jgi:hypothetical protein
MSINTRLGLPLQSICPNNESLIFANQHFEQKSNKANSNIHLQSTCNSFSRSANQHFEQKSNKVRSHKHLHSTCNSFSRPANQHFEQKSNKVRSHKHLHSSCNSFSRGFFSRRRNFSETRFIPKKVFSFPFFKILKMKKKLKKVFLCFFGRQLGSCLSPMYHLLLAKGKGYTYAKN